MLLGRYHIEFSCLEMDEGTAMITDNYVLIQGQWMNYTLWVNTSERTAQVHSGVIV